MRFYFGIMQPGVSFLARDESSHDSIVIEVENPKYVLVFSLNVLNRESPRVMYFGRGIVCLRLCIRGVKRSHK